MLISRGTWQKASPWNEIKPGHGKILFRRRLILLTVCILIFPLSINAQEEKVAILMRGPLPMEGIEFLPINALPVVYGEYEYENTQTAVYYIEIEIFISNSWEKSTCGGYQIYALPAAARSVYYYFDTQGWSVFISLDKGIDEPCLFIAEFIRRFRYFQGIAKDRRNISFPAVLQFN